MDLKERLLRGLTHTRWFTDKLLSEIRDDEDWIRRPVANANHALWITGHLALANNAFIGFVDPARKDPRDDLGPLFGKGTESLDDLGAYPAPSELSEYLTNRGDEFIAVLSDCSEDDLAREVSEGPAFMYDVGAVFQMGAWHEALHGGQLTVIHRLIGQTPIADRT